MPVHVENLHRAQAELWAAYEAACDDPGMNLETLQEMGKAAEIVYRMYNNAWLDWQLHYFDENWPTKRLETMEAYI